MPTLLVITKRLLSCNRTHRSQRENQKMGEETEGKASQPHGGCLKVMFKLQRYHPRGTSCQQSLLSTQNPFK